MISDEEQKAIDNILEDLEGFDTMGVKKILNEVVKIKFPEK